MKPITFTILLLLLASSFASAQHLTPAVIASAGTHDSSLGYHLSWTLGETVIHTYIQTDAALSQGFHQPNFLFDVLVPEPTPEYGLQIYPNPTPNWITIEMNSKEILTAKLFDLFGRLVLHKALDSPKTLIDLSRLPSSTYLLKVLNETDQRIAFWRIQKVR